MMNATLPAYAAMDSSFELDPQSLGASTGSKKTTKSAGRSNTHRIIKPSSTDAGVVHVIKPGENLFKILMRNYGFSNADAESLIEVICRENNISDIRHLKVGQRIVIPSLRRGGSGKSKIIQESGVAQSKTSSGRQMFVLESPEAALSELEASLQMRQAWNKLLPPPSDGQKPIMIQSPTFSLTLDPQRYPVYSAMDGGRILVDRNDSIPPLVKALIMDKDPSIKIVSESPLNGKRFLTAMIESAGFYSVEENFTMDFGTDPRLTVRSDFKIEKTPESLIKQDIVLMSADKTPFPAVIHGFLKKEGFTVFEPFAPGKTIKTGAGGRMFQVTSRSQSGIIDSLLSSISITPDKDRRLDVFAADDNGISLSVKADRYFENAGQRYVVSRFDGDPITYTLYRILETKGYRVAIMEDKDDFRKISEKLLARMNIPAVYAQHKLSPETAANYSLQLSGFKLENPEFPAAGVFITNLELDPVIRDLLAENGYSVITK
jgi:hypothetical protein